MADKIKLIIAGGGTGGHLYPAIALVKEIEQRYAKCEILFFGTAKGIEARILPEMGYKLSLLWLSGVQRSLNLKLLLFPIQFISSIIKCLFVILKFQPNLVIGTGGYVSGPALFLAALFRFPTIIQEQNSYPGVTTRMLAKVVDQVHLTFEESKKYFNNKDKLYISGNPIRKALRAINKDDGLKKFALDPSKKTLLIFGGSQGAHSLNQAILHVLKPILDDDKWQIVWGAGNYDYPEISTECAKFGSRIWLNPYISDMASAYSVADLVVSRAGATTLAELQVCGLPVLLVPYPYAAANHQEANARTLVKQNAAEMILDSELKSDKFMDILQVLLKNNNRRKELGNNIMALAKPDAAKIIIDKSVELIC